MQHAGVVVLAFLLLMLATVGVFILIPWVSNYAFWIAVLAYVILYWGSRIGASWPGIVSLFLLGLAVVGVFINIPFVSNYAFWFAIAAYVIRDWTFNSDVAHVLIWVGLLSLLVFGLAVVGVFACLPFVSNYAYWFVIAVFMIRLFAHIPYHVPQRVGAWRP